MTARLAFALAQSEGVSCGAVLFVDIKQAFYSPIIEFALGPPTLQAVRLVVLQALLFSPDQIADIEKIALAPHLVLLSQYSMAEGLLEVVADSQIGPFFTVAEDSAPTVLFKGTKPGDPLADLLFFVVFGAFHIRLAAALERANLQLILPSPSSTIFGPPDANLTGLPPFRFMDDFFAALRNADAAHLLLDLPRLAVIIAAEARSFGLQVH